MRFIKKFENFVNEDAEAPVKPAVKPTTAPTRPVTRPERPSPIRKDKPAVTPDPKAKETTAEDVANRFIEELHQKGDLAKNYIK